MVAKLTFDAEMLEQDLRAELLDLRKSRQIVSILAEDLRRRSLKAEQQMRFEVHQLQQEVDRQRETNLNRSKKLTLECE